MNPLEGLVANPLFMAGMQILNNNRRMPRSQYQGAFAGVPQALMGAAYNQRMMKQSALEDERMTRMREDWKFQDSERQKREAALKALQGQIGQNTAMNSGAMVDEPPDIQAGGYPMQNPLNPQDIYKTMMQGDQAMQSAALTGMLKPPEDSLMSVGGVVFDKRTRQPIYTAPDKTSEPALIAAYKLAQEQGYKGSIIDYQRETGGQQGQGGNPYFTPIPFTDANGNPTIGSFDNRRGTMAPVILPGGVAPVKSSDSVPLKRSLSEAGAEGAFTGENNAKREFGMRDLRGTIQMARDILNGKDGAKPTSSGLGTAADAVAGFFGGSPESADQAAKLKAIGGVLVSKMPRMEGPQSDADRIQYQQMAGDIGNSMLPISRRLAALEAIQALWAKYDTSGQAGAGGANPGGAPADVLNQADAILNRGR